MAGQREARCVGPSYYLKDKKTAVQRTINMYPMAVEGFGSDPPLVLESVPGLSLVSDLGADIRGMFNADGRMFLAVGSALKEMSSAEAFTDRGTLGVGSSNVSMVNGVSQLAIVDGATYFVLNLDTNTIAQVTSPGWRQSSAVDYIDGYFVFVAPNTDQFYISAVDNAASLDPLDFSSADSQPDNIVRQIVRKRELYLFAVRSTEVWINSGDPDFPLVRYQGTPIDVGLVGPRAVARVADTLVWVGQTERGGPYVYRMDGYQPVRISDQCVEQQLAAADYTNAVCWVYQDAGAEFWCVTAPGMETTFSWNAATQMWTERAELVAGEWQPFRAERCTFFNGRQYVSAGSKLYRYSRDYYTLAGDVLARERTWPHLVAPSQEPTIYRSVELRCTTGSTVEGSITLEVSNDGGSVFYGPQRRSLGVVGQRNRRIRWGPQGTCPAGGGRVFRFRCTDAVPLTIQEAAVA